MPSLSSNSVKIYFRPFSRDELVARLRARMPSLGGALPIQQVVLFGSWAIGRATAASDIDLLVVYDDPPRDDAYSLVRCTVDQRGLEPHVYSAGEAAALRPTLDRMIRDGVEIWPNSGD